MGEAALTLLVDARAAELAEADELALQHAVVVEQQRRHVAVRVVLDAGVGLD